MRVSFLFCFLTILTSLSLSQESLAILTPSEEIKMEKAKAKIMDMLDRSKTLDPEEDYKFRTKGILPKCQKDFEYQLGLCHRKCPEGTKGVGTACYKGCKKGFKDLGIACYKKGKLRKKKSYKRSFKFRGSCPEGQKKVAGLCYEKCKDNYKGFGKTCYKKCGSNSVNLGLFCKIKANKYFKKKITRRTEAPIYKGITKPKKIKYITDPKGRSLILHGVNSSNTSKSNPKFMSWVKEKDVIQETKVFGMNAVRLLIFWAAVEPQKGVYDEAYLERVAKRVKWYSDNGAWVVLDMHQDIYGYAVGGNGAPGWATDVGRFTELKNKKITKYLPEKLKHLWWLNYLNPAVTTAFKRFWNYKKYPYLQDHYIGAWKKVVEKFKNHPGVLGYDLMNEPHSSNFTRSFEKKSVGSMYKRLIKGIREVDQEKWIFFEPRSFGVNFGFRSHLKKVHDARKGEARLAYAPHIYPILLHENISYSSLDRKNVSMWSHARTKEIERHEAPLWVGEFGGNEDIPGFEKYLEEALNMFDYMGGSWMWWSNAPTKGNWGLVDRSGNENKKLHYLVRTYPRAVAGYPLGHSFDVHTGKFILKFKTKNGIQGPTEIFIPKRHYPHGYDIKIYGNKGVKKEWDEESQILYLHTKKSSDPYTVVITRKE